MEFLSLSREGERSSVLDIRIETSLISLETPPQALQRPGTVLTKYFTEPHFLLLLHTQTVYFLIKTQI